MRRVAVIDIGTVTSRLAVADVQAGRVVRMAKRSEITNLGQDVDRTRRLAQEAMERVFACVSSYVATAREAGAEAVCCTLTSAARDAANAAEMGAALASLGLEPMVIPGQVEGALTFLGVAQDFPGEQILVADNGGGSTELARGWIGPDGLYLPWVRSVDIGCRRVTEKHLSAGDPPTAADVAAARAFAREPFDAAVAGMLAAVPERAARLVVTGGTSTTLVAINEQLVPYDPSRVHLARLSRETIDGWVGRLAELTVAQRAELPGIQAKRAPVILGGAVAVAELMHAAGFDELTVSESDLLFGLSIVAALTLDGEPSPLGWKPELRPLS